MIHQVKEAPLSSSRLEQILELQLGLLELAAHVGVLTKTVVEQAGNVEEHLQATYGDQASEVARWVTAKPNLFDKLNEFAAHPDGDEKKRFVTELKADVALLFAPKPQRFKFCVVEATPGWQRAAGEFCMWFYELWRREWKSGPVQYGFPAYLFVPALQADSSFSRWDFVDEFTRENRHLYLCSICDATAYRATVNSRAYTSVEHFFPKSLYPHLVMHPYNLIPICTFCNSGAAWTKNPIDYVSEALGIIELLLPYQSQQPGLSEQAYIEVGPRSLDFSEASSDKDLTHPLEIHMRPASGRDAQPLIDSFERIYGVQQRWNDDLEQIDQHVFRRMRQFLFGDVQLGNDLSDVDFVVARLELLMALTSRENLGQDPFGFATVWLLKHHIDSINEDREDASVYKGLHDWARGQQEHWHALRAHVEELYGRVG